MRKKHKRNIQFKNRGAEIADRYLMVLDHHIDDILKGDVQDFLQIREIAGSLAISHSHLIDILQKEKGNSPSHFYSLKIIEKGKELLINSDISVAKIALMFTYDPSNFSKFFKKWTGYSPGCYRTLNS